ncbi:hypothetical protein [Bacteriovorax sp. DB6_IX]|uniref:hypothetical protein n=1 Tax=Bacteriovorax sp. DB6_IX TaxID=1353530 RepID=UPI00054DA699|nr:hypothetical protein [Bacteriovorax sp. DB6_IX]
MKKIVVGTFLIFGLIYLAYQEVKPTVLTFYFYMVSELTGKPNLAYEDRTDTLLGVDKNNNGIRDDIERYIDERLRIIRPYVRDVIL